MRIIIEVPERGRPDTMITGSPYAGANRLQVVPRVPLLYRAPELDWLLRVLHATPAGPVQAAAVCDPMIPTNVVPDFPVRAGSVPGGPETLYTAARGLLLPGVTHSLPALSGRGRASLALPTERTWRLGVLTTARRMLQW